MNVNVGSLRPPTHAHTHAPLEHGDGRGVGLVDLAVEPPDAQGLLACQYQSMRRRAWTGELSTISNRRGAQCPSNPQVPTPNLESTRQTPHTRTVGHHHPDRLPAEARAPAAGLCDHHLDLGHAQVPVGVVQEEIHVASHG